MPAKTNCTVHGKEKYRIRRKIGEDECGNPVFKNFYGNGKLEAERNMQKYFEENDSSVNRSKSFGKLAEYYTYHVFINEDLAPTTIDLYVRAYIRNLKPERSIMIKPVKDLTVSDVQNLMNRLTSNGIKKSARANLVKYLNYLFKYLEKQGYCRNFMPMIALPRIETTSMKEITVFSEEEIKRILETPSDLHFLYVMAFSTGLRMGELLALEVSDIKSGNVFVSKQVEIYKEYISPNTAQVMVAVRPPKSAKSVRSVPLPSSVQEEYKKYMQNHEKNGLLFTTASGNIIDKSNLRRAWSRHLKAAGVPYKKFHACRSTYCTMLCKQGVPLETASKLMGHSSISITAEFYRSITEDEYKNAADKIDRFFKSE